MWDHSLSSALFIASPSSSRLIIMDTLTCESETIGKWTDSRIHRIYSSPDSSKLLVTYYSDFIKVYDRNTNWSEERWSGLHGGCISAVWSNDSTYLLFANRDQPCIYSVRFATRIELSQDGNQIL
ncbi:unnamed protein product [Anisakis simplex]|uniref:WD_REPEATS_REGION domain-containing protein n=1 Tax=Anisakis simplex TaxID=6269 RepID=A0A0M3KJN1_ANISI|nr:unnamed protein product [Anisakis simplex]